MKVNELFRKMETKYPNQKVGDHIAVSIWKSDIEIYFSDCGCLETALTENEVENLMQKQVDNSFEVHFYGEISNKIHLNVEVK